MITACRWRRLRHLCQLHFRSLICAFLQLSRAFPCIFSCAFAKFLFSCFWHCVFVIQPSVWRPGLARLTGSFTYRYIPVECVYFCDRRWKWQLQNALPSLVYQSLLAVKVECICNGRDVVSAQLSGVIRPWRAVVFAACRRRRHSVIPSWTVLSAVIF